MAANSMTGPIDEFRFGTYDQADTEAALDNGERLTWNRLDAVLALQANDRTFDNTVLGITRSRAEFDAVWQIVGHMESVLGEPWRAADELATERGTNLGNTINFHRGLYEALVGYAEGPAKTEKLSGEQQKLLSELIADYERNGVDLEESEVAKLKEIRLKLSAAQIKFGQNTVNASDTAALWLEDGALEGLDELFIASCAAAAKAEDKPGLKLSYSQPNYNRVMTGCSVRVTRQALYRLHNHLAAEANESVMKDILALRNELATSLGFECYSDYVLEDRMARDGKTALNFVNNLADRYRPQSLKERDDLQMFARRYEGDESIVLDGSDLDTGLDFYYADKLRQEQIGLDEQGLKPFFQLNNVLEQMFATLHTLYGVRFEEHNEPAWHKDVKVYAIFDAKNHHLATVWCDWLARKGKHSGAWMNQFYVADRSNNSYDHPHLGYVCANIAPAEGSNPVLLTFRDLESVWHEFGHFMHAALGKTQLTEQSMLDCLRDFVEAPSQIMENWVWVPEVLSAMAKHYKTGETIPSEIMSKLLASRRFQVASKAMRQFSFAATDLTAHLSYNSASDGQFSDYIRPVKQRYLAVPVLSDDAGMNNFNHIFSGGYASAYYSYKWAEVIEADLFSRFNVEGPLNSSIGAAYRDLVLARGSEVSPAELIRDFLGRDSNNEAVLARDGIAS